MIPEYFSSKYSPSKNSSPNFLLTCRLKIVFRSDYYSWTCGQFHVFFQYLPLSTRNSLPDTSSQIILVYSSPEFSRSGNSSLEFFSQHFSVKLWALEFDI
jgi:hypothetical protein